MNKSEIIGALQTERARYEEMLAQAGVERLNQPGATGEYSFKDVIAHLTAWQRRTVARLQAAKRGETPQLPNWDAEEVDRVNARIFETNRNRSVEEVLREWRQVFQQVINSAEALSEEELADANRFDWMEGEPLSAVLASSYGHYHDEHEPSLRAWLEQMNAPSQRQ